MNLPSDPREEDDGARGTRTFPRASHIAITVPDLEQAEAYYRALFDMELVTREELGPDGDRQLPWDKD